jgi:hypothetical protein
MVKGRKERNPRTEEQRNEGRKRKEGTKEGRKGRRNVLAWFRELHRVDGARVGIFDVPNFAPSADV